MVRVGKMKKHYTNSRRATQKGPSQEKPSKPKQPNNDSLESLLEKTEFHNDPGEKIEVLVDTCSLSVMSPYLYEILARDNNPNLEYSLLTTLSVVDELTRNIPGPKSHRLFFGELTQYEKKKYKMFDAIRRLDFVILQYVPTSEQRKEVVNACSVSCEKHRLGKDLIEDTDIGIIAYALKQDAKNPVIIISEDNHIFDTVEELRKPIYNCGRGYTNIFAVKYHS